MEKNLTLGECVIRIDESSHIEMIIKDCKVPAPKFIEYIEKYNKNNKIDVTIHVFDKNYKSIAGLNKESHLSENEICFFVRKSKNKVFFNFDDEKATLKYLLGFYLNCNQEHLIV